MTRETIVETMIGRTTLVAPTARTRAMAIAALATAAPSNRGSVG